MSHQDAATQALSRRRFVQGAGVAGLGLLAGCGRLPGQAPVPAQPPRIGLLWINSPEAFGPLLDSFRQGLRDFGYVDGENIRLDNRWAAGHAERFPALVTELLALPVDILVAGSEPAAQAAQRATSSIPIVLASSGDPVGSGLVASLARPGGNITGLSSISPQLNGKRLELLQAVAPGVTRVAVLEYTATPTAALQSQETEAGAQALGVRLSHLAVQGPDEIDAALASAASEPVDGLLVLAGGLFVAHREQIIAFAASRRIPAMYAYREFVDLGGLMTYAPSLQAQHRRAAYYVDRILKGSKPADLPVEQPTVFEFVINLKTVQALGLTIPQHVLIQATEIVQ